MCVCEREREREKERERERDHTVYYVHNADALFSHITSLIPGSLGPLSSNNFISQYLFQTSSIFTSACPL